MKVVFLVWLVAPQFKGATQIYQKFLGPFFHRYEEDIDKHVAEVKDRSSKHLGKLAGQGLRHLRSQSADLISYGMSQLSRSNSDIVNSISESKLPPNIESSEIDLTNET